MVLQGWATSGFNLNSGFFGGGKYCIFFSNSRQIFSLQVFFFFPCAYPWYYINQMKNLNLPAAVGRDCGFPFPLSKPKTGFIRGLKIREGENVLWRKMFFFFMMKSNGGNILLLPKFHLVHLRLFTICFWQSLILLAHGWYI